MIGPMRIRRFYGHDLPEIMAVVRKELGREAVILEVKKRRMGLWGLFGRTQVEVLAAAEEKTSPEVLSHIGSLFSPPVTASPSPKEPAIAPRELEGSLSSTKPAESGQRAWERLETELEGWKVEVSDNLGSLQSEVAGLKGSLIQLTRQLGPQDAFLALFPEARELPAPWLTIFRHLVEGDADPRVARSILLRALEQLNGTARSTDPVTQVEIQIRQAVRGTIKAELGLASPVQPKPDRPTVVAFTGPTGVGKTTTIAKLAAAFALAEQKEVRLITVDTYRIAALEQLKTFGEIIGIPVEVAFTPKELHQLLAKRRLQAELILIDTAGRSHNRGEQMHELGEFLAAASPDETHLVLSLVTKRRDLEEVLQTYDGLYNRLLFTKADETRSYGGILNAISSTRRPISYLTVGQNVPADIEVADPDRLTRLLLGEESR